MSCENQCSKEYVSLCSIPPRMSRDGWAGEFAKIYLPFHGLMFFSGASLDTSGATIAQDKYPFLGGISKPDTYRKEGGYVGGRI
jgi:hypothetical protein